MRSARPWIGRTDAHDVKSWFCVSLRDIGNFGSIHLCATPSFPLVPRLFDARYQARRLLQGGIRKSEKAHFYKPSPLQQTTIAPGIRASGEELRGTMATTAKAASEITTKTMGSESCGPMVERQRQAAGALFCECFSVPKNGNTRICDYRNHCNYCNYDNQKATITSRCESPATTTALQSGYQCRLLFA